MNFLFSKLFIVMLFVWMLVLWLMHDSISLYVSSDATKKRLVLLRKRKERIVQLEKEINIWFKNTTGKMIPSSYY